MKKTMSIKKSALKVLSGSLAVATIAATILVSPTVRDTEMGSSSVGIVANAAIPISNYRIGSKGTAVSYIQYNLRILGYPVGTIDGIYGKVLETQVKAFQKKCGFSKAEQDGVCGKNTLAYLNDAGRQIQTLLNQAGYPCTIDSICGKKTIAALNQFQRDYKFTVSNKVTTTSLKKLQEVAASKKSAITNGATTASNSISTQRQKMINLAYNELNRSGVSGKSNKYTRWYYGNNQSSAWCSIFVSWLARQNNISPSVLPTNARCDYMQQAFQKMGRSRQYYSNISVKPGDLVTVCTCGSGNRYHREHIGIVVEVSSTTLTVIEGNTSGYVNGRYSSSCVAKKTYARSTGKRTTDYCKISYVLSPNY